MATTVRSSAQNSSGTGTAISISAPAGTVTGDVVIISILVNGGATTIVDNNGSTSFTEDIDDYQPGTVTAAFSIFSRRIQAGDPSTYNFTASVSGRWSIIAVTLQSPNASSIYDVAPNTANVADYYGGSSDVDAPSITTLTDGAIDIALAYLDTGEAANWVTLPSGYTTIQLCTTGQPQAAVYKVITSAGATGVRSFNGTAWADRFGFSFAIKDVGEAPPASAFIPRRMSMGIG